MSVAQAQILAPITPVAVVQILVERHLTAVITFNVMKVTVVVQTQALTTLVVIEIFTIDALQA